MKNLFFHQTIFRFPLYFFLSVAVILTGCGAGKPDAPVSTAPSLTIALTSGGVPVSSITSGTPATAKATLKDATGTAVVGAVVTFSTDTALATIAPATTALTDSSGVATVTLSPASVNATGATTITATSQVGTTALTGTIGYSVGSSATSPSLAIALSNGGVSVTSITSGTPATVTAILKDATGAAVAGAVVTFSTDTTLATISPASTALTDASGVATVTLNSATLTATGATTITATSQVGTTALTGTIGYSVGSAVVTITNPVFGVGASSLSAFGTTSVAVTVCSGGPCAPAGAGVPVTTPQTVTFSSPCASSGKAVLSASVVTVNGVATGSYRDNGCAGNDTVTASVSGITSSSATLTVTAPTAGSIQYVSSVPSNISLKGTGGTEAAQVTFKVLDTGGNPLSGKTVSFGLSTTVGGITLTPGGTATSDANGLVVTTVNAGTVSTPVRVTANTCTTPTNPCTGTTLTTQSSQLTITTGIPDQQNFSLGATTFNIEGWNIDGTTTVLTARLADHFGNPVPDGTAVNFITEGGLVTPSCTTTASACSATLTSQALRPTNGRVTVLAYAVGEEGFTDLNANGLADNPTEMFDANGVSTDMGEAYVDYNENRTRDPATEPFIDFGGSVNGSPDGQYNGPDGKYNGVLCDSSVLPGSSPTACNTQKTIDVRGSSVIVFSSSAAKITINGGAAFAIPPCNLVNGDVPATFTVTVVDENGNAMPAGTTVAFTTNNGKITSPASYIVPNSIGCRSSTHTVSGVAVPDFPGCPASAGSATFGDIPVTMQSDATFAVGTPNTCTNASNSGTFTVTVTTPSNSAAPATTVTTATATVTD